jgi:hypothetical protein
VTDDEVWTDVWVWEKGHRMKLFDTEEAARSWLEAQDPTHPGALSKRKQSPLRPAGSADKYGVPRLPERPNVLVFKEPE